MSQALESCSESADEEKNHSKMELILTNLTQKALKSSHKSEAGSASKLLNFSLIS